MLATMARHRLPLDAYTAPGTTWLVTISVHDRTARPLGSDHVAHIVADTMTRRAAELRVTLWAWRVMPDHLHLITSTGDWSLIDVIGDLKSHTIRAWWALGNRGRLWQPSFHDRGLRTWADVNEAIQYVLDNPVRAGLVEEWRAYPWSGGKGVAKE